MSVDEDRKFAAERQTTLLTLNLHRIGSFICSNSLEFLPFRDIASSQ
jgi:hypothetical protein